VPRVNKFVPINDDVIYPNEPVFVIVNEPNVGVADV
jgi:hypothetical protein